MIPDDVGEAQGCRYPTHRSKYGPEALLVIQNPGRRRYLGLMYICIYVVGVSDALMGCLCMTRYHATLRSQMC